MLGQVLAGRTSSSIAGSRCFRYEVVGLHQSQETNKIDYPIRSSGSVFFTVPYSRMNDEMQRIARLGGRIVSIQPVVNSESGEHSQPSEEHSS